MKVPVSKRAVFSYSPFNLQWDLAHPKGKRSLRTTWELQKRALGSTFWKLAYRHVWSYAAVPRTVVKTEMGKWGFWFNMCLVPRVCAYIQTCSMCLAPGLRTCTQKIGGFGVASLRWYARTCLKLKPMGFVLVKNATDSSPSFLGTKVIGATWFPGIWKRTMLYHALLFQFFWLVLYILRKHISTVSPFTRGTLKHEQCRWAAQTWQDPTGVLPEEQGNKISVLTEQLQGFVISVLVGDPQTGKICNFSWALHAFYFKTHQIYHI